MKQVLYSIIVVLLMTCSVAYAAAPVVNAGVDKTMAFPQADMTLFGEASDSDNDALTITWSQVSGPGGATMSAPWALANTIHFTNTGTYVFRLTVFDGSNTVTDTMTATVLSAASQTAFYVDPTYTGGSNDGSAAHPWTTISGLSSSSAPWTAINAALASNNVIVYFSARQAGSDTPEVDHAELNLWRSNTSTNRFTLDGMSKYNTNDSSGSWTDYTGSNKFHVNITNGSTGIGVQVSSAFPMQYTTVRGFDVSGHSGRLTIAGDYMDIEYVDVHDITGSGANIQVQPPRNDFPSCSLLFGVRTNMALRHNTVVNGYGEGLYIAGTYRFTGQNGCPQFGNTHTHILLEGNHVLNAGKNGGQGDGVDLKVGLQWVTVRGNILEDCYSTAGFKSQCNGITSDGVFSPSVGRYTIEQNVVHGCQRCMYLGPNFDMDIRNNIVYDSTQMGLAFDTQAPGVNRAHIYNNTWYGNADVGMNLGGISNSDSRNNILFGNDANGIQSIMQGATATTNDYNLYGIGGAHSSMNEGVHSVFTGTNTGITVDPANGDFTLGPSSPALNVGVTLTTFNVDYVSAARPQGIAWDIGAYERVSGVAPTVSLVSPNSGSTAGGLSVTVTGTNFTNVQSVRFGVVMAASFTVNSSTSITVTSPAQSAGTVDVIVQTVNGSSAISNNDKFTYVAPPPPQPTVTAVSPNNGPTTGGTSVTLTGTGFLSGTTVSFGGSAGTSVVVVTSTSITCISPAHSAGLINVTVTNAGGTSSTGAGNQFTYVSVAPTVSNVNPNSGNTLGNTDVVITGTNFIGATAVKFDVSNATSYTVVNSTTINATSPAHAAGTIHITVTTANGTSSTSVNDQFTYVSIQPVITSISPNNGTASGGTIVTVTGTGFTGTTNVNFDVTAAASFVVNSSTQITATSPAHSAGVVDITVVTPNGTSVTGAQDQFTFNAIPPPPVPTVTNVNPNSGDVNGGTSVTVIGTDFTGATAVNFGAASASFSVTDSTHITATSPAHTVGTVHVTVTTPDGVSSTSVDDQFTYTPVIVITAPVTIKIVVP